MLKPYEFQQEIIDRFKDQNTCALLLEAGVGKTIISINILRYKFNVHREILPTIIFCPIIVLNNWKREILACSKIPEEAIGIVMGSSKARLKTIIDPKNKILIINYEATRSDDIYRALMNFRPWIVICDESHKIKGHKLKTPKKKPTLTGAIFNISQDAMYKQILSGTPVPKPEDIWSQYYFLDRGFTFGDRFHTFKKRYFMNKNDGWDAKNAFPDWQFIESQTDEYKTKLASLAVSMKKEECINLPDLVETVIDIEPSLEMIKHYKDVAKKLITWIDGQEDNPLVVQNALTKTLRLAEILSGYLKLEDESIHVIKDNPTLDGLMELMDSTADNKVIVWCVFKQNYKDIAKRLEKKKLQFVEIHGGISTKNKLANVDIFNDMSNDVKVCIAHPAAGGVGINLKSAPYSVWYSLGYSLVDFEQSRARNFRSGSIDLHPKITHYFLNHKNLLTEKILKSVKNKQSFANNLLDLKNMLREL